MDKKVCFLCSKLKLKPDPAKFNQIFSFPSSSDTGQRWIKLLFDPFEPFLDVEISICELHFLPEDIIRYKNDTEEALPRAELTISAIPVNDDISKIIDFDYIGTKRTNLTQKYKQFLNLHQWKVKIARGGVLTFEHRSQKAQIDITGFTLTATIHEKPLGVEQHTKAGKIEQWSKLRGLLKAIEDHFEAEEEEKKVEIIEFSCVFEQIIKSDVVKRLRWRIIKSRSKELFLYKLKFLPIPRITTSIAITETLEVKGFAGNKEIPFKGSFCLRSIEEFIQELEGISVEEVFDHQQEIDQNPDENVTNFLENEGKICRICLFWVNSDSNAQFYQLTRSHYELLDETQAPFSSEICEKCFKSLETFKKLKENVQNSQQIFERIEFTFNEKKKEEILLKIDKKEPLGVLQTEPEPRRPAPQPKGKKKFRSKGPRALRICDLCGFSCDYIGTMRIHMERMHVASTIPCCGRMWNPMKLNAHQRVVHRKDKNCEICGRRFGFQDNLRDHMKKFHGKKGEFVCEHCGSDFSINSLLTKHLAVAHQQKSKEQVVCDICGIHFHLNAIANHKLSAHSGAPTIGIRTGEGRKKYKFKSFKMPEGILEPERSNKAFKCSECPLSYDNEARLKRHIQRIHQKLRKNKCPICSKGFFSQHEVTVHVRGVHTKENIQKCPICEKPYNKENMRKHLTWVHTDSYFVCSCCEKKVKHGPTMRRHVWSKHQINATPKVMATMKRADEDGIQRMLEMFKEIYEDE